MHDPFCLVFGLFLGRALALKNTEKFWVFVGLLIYFNSFLGFWVLTIKTDENDINR